MTDQPSITCPVCGMTSYHPTDIAEGYCGNCHSWTSDGSDIAEVCYGNSWTSPGSERHGR